MVVWVQAVCSSAARIASPASSAGAAEHLLGGLVRVRADLLGLGEDGVRVGVGVLAERLGLLGGVRRTAAASSSAVIRSSSAARTVSSCW